MRLTLVLPLFLLLSGISVQNVQAAAPDPAETTLAAQLEHKSFFGIGLQAGLATGSGVSLRYTMPNRFALEMNGGYFAVNDPVWSVGFEVQFQLNTTDNTRLYALAGAGAYSVSRSDSNSLSAPLRIGVGVGYEWFVGKQFSLAAELPITIFIESKATVLPLPQIQMIYYFK